MKIGIIPENLVMSSCYGIGATLPLAEQGHSIMYLCPDAFLAQQLRQGITGFNEEAQKIWNKYYQLGDISVTSALGQAVAYGEELRIYDNDLITLKDALWRLKLKDKSIIVYGHHKKDYIDSIFKDFITGKEIKSYSVEPI